MPDQYAMNCAAAVRAMPKPSTSKHRKTTLLSTWGRRCFPPGSSSPNLFSEDPQFISCLAGAPNRQPWAAKRCPGNIDPNPVDTSANACLTDGQIATLQFVYRPYTFAAPLSNNVASFGMWLPNTDPSGSGLIVDPRFKGQEGAPENAPMHSHLGVLGVTA